jgi:hypothetical protein
MLARCARSLIPDFMTYRSHITMRIQVEKQTMHFMLHRLHCESLVEVGSYSVQAYTVEKQTVHIMLHRLHCESLVEVG